MDNNTPNGTGSDDPMFQPPGSDSGDNGGSAGQNSGSGEAQTSGSGQPPASGGKSYAGLIIGIIAVIVIVGGGLCAFFFLGGQSPKDQFVDSVKTYYADVNVLSDASQKMSDMVGEGFKSSHSESNMSISVDLDESLYIPNELLALIEEIRFNLVADMDIESGAFGFDIGIDTAGIKLDAKLISAGGDGFYIESPQLFSKPLFISNEDLGMDVEIMTGYFQNMDSIREATVNMYSFSESELKAITDELTKFLNKNITDAMVKSSQIDLDGASVTEYSAVLKGAELKSVIAAFHKEVLLSDPVVNLVSKKASDFAKYMEILAPDGSLYLGDLENVKEEYIASVEYSMESLESSDVPEDASLTISTVPGQPGRLLINFVPMAQSEISFELKNGKSDAGNIVSAVLKVMGVDAQDAEFAYTNTDKTEGGKSTGSAQFNMLFDGDSVSADITYEGTSGGDAEEYTGTYSVDVYGEKVADGTYSFSMNKALTQFNMNLVLNIFSAGSQMASVGLMMDSFTSGEAVTPSAPSGAMPVSDLSMSDYMEIQQNLTDLIPPNLRGLLGLG